MFDCILIYFVVGAVFMLFHTPLLYEVLKRKEGDLPKCTVSLCEITTIITIWMAWLIIALSVLFLYVLSWLRPSK